MTEHFVDHARLSPSAIRLALAGCLAMVLFRAAVRSRRPKPSVPSWSSQYRNSRPAKAP